MRVVPLAESTLEIISRVSGTNSLKEDNRPLVRIHEGFVPKVALTGVNFNYPNNEKFALRNLNLELNAGESCGVIGDSGAGKSTLADLILGIIDAQSGTVQVSGLSPREAIDQWPGAIGFVPQEIYLTRGSIKENICLGFDQDSVPDQLVWDVLNLASLDEFVRDLPLGLQTRIGDGEKSLSGGQRQRIGIARALLSSPRLIVFDEATSSLDNRTEKEITDTLNDLKKLCTLIVIAHRFSTIQNVDKLVIMQSGQITDFGPKAKVIGDNPNLAQYFTSTR